MLPNGYGKDTECNWEAIKMQLQAGQLQSEPQTHKTQAQPRWRVGGSIGFVACMRIDR